MKRLLVLAWEAGLVWCGYHVALRLPAHRWEQLKEFGLCCALLFVVMVIYKRWHGQPVVW